MTDTIHTGYHWEQPQALELDSKCKAMDLRACTTPMRNRLPRQSGFAGLALLLTASLVLTPYAPAAGGQEVSKNAAQLPAIESAPPNIPAWARDRQGQFVPPHDEHVIPATPPPPGLYVSLGDSITYGYGVSQNCHAFPVHPVDIASYCPDGNSYAILVAKALRDAGVAGHFMNLGINGATISRVVSDELPYLPADATLVTLYIGTNDSRAVRDPAKTVEVVVQKYETGYDQLLRMIHQQAPGARVVLINFPNQKYLAAGYHVPDDVLPRYDKVSQILASFINGHYPDYAVVDTICNSASYDQSLLYRATVHPNEEGSVILARSVTDAILAKNPPAPLSGCTWFHSAAAAAPPRN